MKNSQAMRMVRFLLSAILTLQWFVYASLQNDLSLPIGIQKVEAAVPADIIVMWPSTNGTIPGGWSRVAELDEYFIEGTITNPNTAPAGAAIHSHTAPDHQHSITHNHSGNTGDCDGTGVISKVLASLGAPHLHSHSTTVENASGNNNNKSFDLDPASNHPPFTSVIFIRSEESTEIPNGAWAFYESDSLPGSWTRQSEDRFLRGAVSGGDGGGTGGFGGHIHSNTAPGHTHTEDLHTHTITVGVLVEGQVNSDTKNTTISGSAHTHTASDPGATATEQADSSSLVSGTGNDPPFIKLNVIQNGTGGAQTPDNIIAMWMGTTASVPDGWEICNGSNGCPNLDDYFIKGAASNGESGITTGGGTDHLHSGSSPHNHTIESHDHTVTVNTSSDDARGPKLDGGMASPVGHGHPLSYSSGGTTGDAAFSASTSVMETRPEFKEVVFIMRSAEVGLFQNDFEWFVTANLVSVSDPWPFGSYNLAENDALTQLPATNLPLSLSDKIRVQMNLTGEGAYPADAETFQLEYSAAEDCTTASSWTTVGAKASGTIWRLFDEASIGDSTVQTNQISTSSTAAEGYYSEIIPSGTNPNPIGNNLNSEWDWPLENNGATDNTTYCFRVILSDTALYHMHYNSDGYPKLTTKPGQSSIMRHGNFFQNLSESGYYWAN